MQNRSMLRIQIATNAATARVLRQEARRLWREELYYLRHERVDDAALVANRRRELNARRRRFATRAAGLALAFLKGARYRDIEPRVSVGNRVRVGETKRSPGPPSTADIAGLVWEATGRPYERTLDELARWIRRDENVVSRPPRAARPARVRRPWEAYAAEYRAAHGLDAGAEVPRPQAKGRKGDRRRYLAGEVVS